MYELCGFTENLNIHNFVNSTENFVQQMFGLCGFTKNLNFADTLNVQNCINSM